MLEEQIQWSVCVSVCLCVCEKELTHSITEAGKSQDLEGELGSWRPRRASGLALVQVRRPKNQTNSADISV